MGKAQDFETFVEKHLPHLYYVTPSSSDYAQLRHAYIVDNVAVPLAIARPKTAEDVAFLVKYALSAGIEVTVRTGGHDLYGRCFAQDALAIDMREIAFVRVSDDKASATIGGGILTGELVASLAEHKLATAIGTISSVGYFGWAAHGGYGPFSGCYGLGADQILAAKVVNAEGKIVDADSEMLRAIRGAGGTLGVVVELTVKLYSLDKILAGAIVFESKNLATTIQSFESKYRDVSNQKPPGTLSVQHTVANTPMGKAFLVEVMWSSPDFEEGGQWLDKISSLAPVLFNGVKETTLPEVLKEAEAVVPKSGYGGNLSVNVRGLTDEILQVIASEIVKMPDDPLTLFSILGLRGSAASPNDESVFGSRTPHYLIELIATSSDAVKASVAWKWASNFRDALEKTDSQYILPTTYISLTPPADASLRRIYHDRMDRLVDIKRKYDPNNVFKHALPNF